MFISKEMAHAMAEGRRRFLSVYEGRAVLFMPYADGVRHLATHYVPELTRSITCTGEATCRYHHLKEVAKCHVAALVHRQALKWEDREGKLVSPRLTYSPIHWALKIVELTEKCFDPFERGAPYGTMATIGRKPGRKNNEVEFHWLDGKELLEFPQATIAPEEVVPAVIRGTYYPGATVGLDKNPDGSIKHKSPYQTSQVEKGENE